MTAYAFGPFENESLELAEGFTVLCGPNEAGKSSWHAALYAGLCGARRGRGISEEERAFRARHHPWDAERWEVGCVVRLADGRRVELRHDLDGKVSCRATDADIGRDYSAEIIVDGAPDGSAWLGLNRRSFLATACVKQAQILGIAEDPRLLREHLQRAAATSTAEGTAAAALGRLDAYRTAQVGTTRSNSTRPLRLSLDAVARAEIELASARQRHADYLEIVERLEALQTEAGESERALQIAEAAQAVNEADTLARLAPRPTPGRIWLLVAAVLALSALIALWTVGPIPALALLLAAIVAAAYRQLALRERAQRREDAETLARSVGERRANTAARGSRLDPAELAAARALPDLDSLIARRRDDLTEARANVARTQGRLEIVAASVGSVPEAEETLVSARAELERLQRLDRTLDLTRGLLDRAQQRVHRDIAPVIAASLRRWLPAVTAGRYSDVRVDPESLDLSVLDPEGRWRDASLISHGTAEQVYLLLRVALAELLARKEEPCPLLLDDVTVQADPERTEAILETLHALSQDRQVILFSQEADVLSWARANLREPRDHLVVLSGAEGA